MSSARLPRPDLYAFFEAAFPPDRSLPLLALDEHTLFSYGDAERESDRLAATLARAGARPGDRITVQVEKSPTALWLYLACLKGGFVFHPLNTAYKREELSYFLENAEPRVVVCDPASAGLMWTLVAGSSRCELLTLDAAGEGSLVDAGRDVDADFARPELAAGDLAALLYSSGTTGVPKGIMLSHRNLVSNARSLVRAWGFTGADVLLHALPIFHVHGLFVALGCVLGSGARMEWLPGFDVDAVRRRLPRSTVMMGVPTYYTRLLGSDLDRHECAGMRLFISGSAPLLTATFEQFEHRTGHRILERYGMTETGMNTSNPLHGARRPGTVGPPLPGVEVRVVDAAGAVLASGEIGALQVRGDNVFRGYWRLPDRTAQDFTQDGFFDTGDQGCIEADGYVRIVGRAKDMIISGGLNVYPKEVEGVIDAYEGVLESAVFGVPHADFGEAVVAAVVPRAGITLDGNAIVDFARQRLANFKVPKRIVFLEALPRNTMGKVQKNRLRDDHGTLLGS